MGLIKKREGFQVFLHFLRFIGIFCTKLFQITTALWISSKQMSCNAFYRERKNTEERKFKLSAILIEKIASLVEFIMSWARRWIEEDDYGELAPDFSPSGTICSTTIDTHQSLLLESFLHGFKVWCVCHLSYCLLENSPS